MPLSGPQRPAGELAGKVRRECTLPGLRPARRPFPHTSLTAIVVKELDLDKLLGLSHAEIERICIDVLKRIALEGRKHVTREDFDEALARQERRKQALAKSQAIGLPEVD